MHIGEIIQLKGFVTTQIYLQGMTLEEVERRLGYRRGRLSQGAYFLVAQELPQARGFDLAGYSQVAGHHTAEQYGDINNPADANLERSKGLASKNWGLNGSSRLVKALPIQNQMTNVLDEEYPPGSGIPQWKLTLPIRFVVEDIVVEYPSGRFKPRQGFKEVAYK